MEMLTQATELFRRIENQIKETENIEEQSGEQTKVKIQILKYDLIKNKEIVNKIIEAIQRGELNCLEREQLVEKVRNLEKKVADNERQIIRLEREILEKDKLIKELKTDVREFKHQLTTMQHNVEKLTQTQNDLLKVEGALQTGQLAYNFEKDLARYIYPPGKNIGSKNIFTTMKDWLKKKEHTHEGREANKKWNDLQREFSWSPAHERVFFKLVKSRIIVAHPNVDLRVVQSHVVESFTDEENERIKDLIEINDRVNDLMKE